MQRLMTPSKITAWLDCPHYLTLRSRVDSGQLAEPGGSFGSFARLLADKGVAHEQECLLNTRARTVDDMRLIATLNAFVECAQGRSTQTVGM